MFSMFNNNKTRILEMEYEITRLKGVLKDSELKRKELLDSYRELQVYTKTQNILNANESTRLGETISNLETELKDPRKKTLELEEKITQLNSNISILEKDKEHISKLYANSIINQFYTYSYVNTAELADFYIAKNSIDKDINMIA